MISRNKYRCLELGIHGFIDHRYRSNMKKLSVFPMMIVSWFLVGIYLKSLYPDYVEVITKFIFIINLNNLLLFVYLFLSNIFDWKKDMFAIHKFFNTIESSDENKLLKDLKDVGIDIEDLDRLIECVDEKEEK